MVAIISRVIQPCELPPPPAAASASPFGFGIFSDRRYSKKYGHKREAHKPFHAHFPVMSDHAHTQRPTMAS